MADYRAVQPHGEIQEIFKNIYVVTGTNVTTFEGVTYQTSRNMTILRASDGTITLVNTVRLNEDGLSALESLGEVKHVVRIGAFHGYDDPFYVDKYNAQYWLMPNMPNEYAITEAKVLTQETLPIEGGHLFAFNTTSFAEGALYLEQNEGVLITCDSVQNWSQKDPFFSDECWDMFVQQGLIGEANIPDTWIGACQPKKSDYMNLISFKPFKHLISAHGKPLLNEAAKKLLSNIESKDIS